MDRRGFLKLFSAGVAGIALDQAIPLGRVWSFPKKIVLPVFAGFDPASGSDFTVEECWEHPFKVGTAIRIRLPQRFIIRDYIGDFSQPEQYKTVTLLNPDDRFSIENVNIEN
jgi:hypothetical protein